MEKTSDTFFDTFKAMCKERGTDMKKECQKAGFSYNTLMGSRRRGNMLEVEKILALADSMNVSIADFFPETRKPSDIVNIPFLPQTLSAGPGQELVEACEVRQFSVMESLARKYPKESLFAAEVRGDSMEGANISDGDIVIFSHGFVRGDGIYVFTVQGEVFVKRLEFDPFENKVRIISENAKYGDKVVPNDPDIFTILGKVVTYIHGF